MTRQITGWRCLDCDKTWTGGALASVKPVTLTDLGEELKAHVIAEGHACAPITVEVGQQELAL